MKVLRGRGLVIPDEVAVVGYDNTDLWLALDPTLTTVDYRAAEVQGADVVSVTEGNTDRRVSASGCTHVPDSEPGKRVPEARLGTRSCSWGFVVHHPR